MLRTRFLLVLATVGFTSGSTPATAALEESWPFYHWPTSSEYAKKRGEFLFSVKAVPDNFTWERHKVVVFDSWKQRCGNVYYLFFKLNIDGTSTGEHNIVKHGGPTIVFRHDGDAFPNPGYGIDDYRVAPLRRVLKATVGIPSTDTVHYVTLNPDTREVRLRVGTHKKYKFPTLHLKHHPNEDPNYTKSLVPTMDATILDFDVSSDQSGAAR